MIYGSVCSGIEAATAAWHSLGWRPAFFSEIEKFPRAVLAHRWPGVPLHGDFTTIREGDYEPIDLLVGGTPCQSFSVAGRRLGLADPRGNLTLEYLALARRLRPRWLVWENVPGVLSIDGGRTFGAVLAIAAGHADGHVFEPPADGWRNAGIVAQAHEHGWGLAWRVLDAQYFGVPQRRRRVFLVGHLGDWTRAAAVLFEPESLRGDPPPRRASGAGLAGALDASLGGGGPDDNDARGGHLVAAFGGNDTRGSVDVAAALNAHGGAFGRLDFESETFVAHSLRAEGFDASEDGTSHSVAIAFDPTQVTSPDNYSSPQPGDPCHPLATVAHAPLIAFSAKDHGADAGEVAPALRAMGHDGSHANGGGQVAVAFNITPSNSNKDFNAREATYAQALTASGGAPSARGGDAIVQSAVRRLTPREAERLQGFPDDYTLIPVKKVRRERLQSPRADKAYREINGEVWQLAADGPRYRALGNSFAVPVVRWIGQRIAMVAANFAEAVAMEAAE